MHSQPLREHQWLQKFVGEWTCDAEMVMEPGKPPEKSQANERVRTLGGLWILAEGEGEMPGGGACTTLLTLGYDPRQKRYVGTWVGSMMTHLWVYTGGSLDAAQKVLTLEAEGPSFTEEGKLAKYRDVIEFKSDDQRMLTSHVQGDNGEWSRIMTATYRRKK